MVTLSLGNKKKTYPSISAAAKEMGINYMTLYRRLQTGKSAVSAVKTPVRKYKPRKTR